MRRLPWRHDRKLDFHSFAEPLVNPEVKTASRNIACPSQNRLELLEVGLEPDFYLKGQFVATSCPTFFQFTWPNALTNSHQPLGRLQGAVASAFHKRRVSNMARSYASATTNGRSRTMAGEGVPSEFAFIERRMHGRVKGVGTSQPESAFLPKTVLSRQADEEGAHLAVRAIRVHHPTFFWS